MVSVVPSGLLQVSATMPGFKMQVREVNHDATRSKRVDIRLEVGSSAESVTVTAEAPLLKTESAEVVTFNDRRSTRPSPADKLNELPALPPSTNVTDLQRRVTGVLPIAVNVPRTGSSYRFVRALAVDEETRLTFRYRTK